MEIVPPFGTQDLASIAKILGDTSDGLTGSEIGYLLQDCEIPDVTPETTKWKRLFNAFIEFQNKRQFGNHVVVFINHAMNPAQYTQSPTLFSERRDQLNTVLSFSGMYVGEDGKVRRAKKASNLNEAMKRANRLHAELTSRRVHQNVLRFCKAELLQENYFHAVFEALKSITSKIRELSDLDSDGAKLVDEAFGLGKDCNPILAINDLSSETRRGEQTGYINLLKGLLGTIRNPLAHTPKIEWDMSEQDTLDILTTLSLVHRKLDRAYRYRQMGY